MNKISDLQTVFASTQNTSGSDGTRAAARNAYRKDPSLSGTVSEQSSLDRSNVSLAGGTLHAALNVSDVRTEKVAALQQAINNGTYKVSSSDVADKLIQSMLGRQ